MARKSLFKSTLLRTLGPALLLLAASQSSDVILDQDHAALVDQSHVGRTLPPDPWPQPIEKECESFFMAYVERAGNFTSCQLYNARPFRVCTKCIDQYARLDVLYEDFSKTPRLEGCRRKYMRSDRVQVIPTVQSDIQKLWDDADCSDCSENVHVDPETGKVNFTFPSELSRFLDLYVNLSKCVGLNLTDDPLSSEFTIGNAKDNVSNLCEDCKLQYRALNDHYNKVSASKSNILCMDMVDMMNHTRLVWSTQLNCSHRSGDPVAVVLITCVVASSPAFFYIILRVTGKEKRKKVLIQKRLTHSVDVISSMSRSYAGQGDSNVRVMSRIAS